MVPFLYAFMFIRVSENEWLSAIIIIAASIASHVAWNFSYVANATLISVVGKTPEDKATLASSRATWNNIGGLLFSYMGLPFATLLAGYVGEKNKFAAAAFCLGILMVVTYFAHFKMTDGYEETETEAQVAKAGNDKTKITIGEMFSSLFQNPPLMVLMLADLAKWCVKFVTAASAIYYFRDAMGNPGLMTTYLLSVAVGAIIGAFSHEIYCESNFFTDDYDYYVCRNGSVSVPCIYILRKCDGRNCTYDAGSVLLWNGICGISGTVCGYCCICYLEERKRCIRMDYGLTESAAENCSIFERNDFKRLPCCSRMAVRCSTGRYCTSGNDDFICTCSGNLLSGGHAASDIRI